MVNNKKIKSARLLTSLLILSVLIILSMSVVSAEFWACFSKGNVVHYCNGYKPDWTCGLNNGCQKCMSEYRESENCYVHGVWNKCNQIPQECATNGSGTIDSEPPVLTIDSPIQDAVYDSRSVLLDLGTNERADIYYLDLIDGRGRWTRVCTDCMSYYRTRSFQDGYAELMFRATDVVGNPTYQNISFFVDSKDPRILKTNPRNGFTNGFFEVQFKEENPVELLIKYGNGVVTRTHEVDIDSECQLDKTKYYCDTFIDLDEFDGQEIEYWAELTDIAGNKDESKPRTLDVDTTSPTINNPGSMYTINGRYVYFSIDITEENLDEVFYSYVDSRGKVRDKRLCSRLKNGICEKKANFKEGHWEITISVIDDAGNLIGIPKSFDISY